MLRLPDDVDDLDVVSRLAERGLAASPLSAYAVEATVRGLVLCYAGLPETQADAAVRRLAETLAPGSPAAPPDPDKRWGDTDPQVDVAPRRRQRTSCPGCGSVGMVPSRPAWKSSNACTSSSRVFMTNGP